MVADATRLITKILKYHNCPGYLSKQLLHSAEQFAGNKGERLLLKILAHHFDVSPINPAPGEPALMLIGAPGVGKTMTAAKMATSLTMQGIPVAVITTDSHKAGGIEQLQAFTDILGISLGVAESPEDLGPMVAERLQDYAVIIDTPGYNPYDAGELKHLGQWIASQKHIEPVLVVHAGMDVMEAADIASNFAYLGPGRLMVTKTDAARRYGGMLAAAYAGNLAFSHFSRHAGAVEGLEPIQLPELAKLLLHHHLSS
jgi:flagellar biosynthesis protein FlhF